MHFALIGDDQTDAAAPARRLEARPRHLANLLRWATAGRLVLSGPRMPDDETTIGSLQFFDVEGPAAMQDYLAEEPFAREGIWARTQVLPFRIAPLPYTAPPQPGEAPVFTWAVIAMDAPGALEKRVAARPRHIEGILPLVQSGVMRLGGAVLDAPDGAMIGSIMAFAVASEAEARAIVERDPYTTEGVWRDVTYMRWRIGPQAYKPLPGQAA